MADILNQLTDLLGERRLLTGDALSEHPACAMMQPLALMRPDSTELLSHAMRLCHNANQAVVPLGGNTGLVAGGRANAQEIVLSLELMSGVESLDAMERTITVKAGTAMEVVQNAADEADLLFALDLGARGSATIGGNIATNAGGNRVLRYGMTRDMVLGLEAVLADGTVVSSMNRVIKNNTGYDLKQLFIGSEGTLGVVTRAVLRLRPKPLSNNCALVAVNDLDSVIALLGKADSLLGGSLSSFEVMWDDFYCHVTDGGKRHQLPLPDTYPFYVIIEALGSDQARDDERFNGALEQLFEDGTVVDGIVCQSLAEREAVWKIRDDIEALYQLYPICVYDISMPLRELDDYLIEVREHVKTVWGPARCIVFGHLGDGNIHLLVTAENDQADTKRAVDSIVYGALRSRDGVISAEHGIGLEKKDHLDVSRNAVEIALMRRIKQTLDPKNLLNPGKIFDL